MSVCFRSWKINDFPAWSVGRHRKAAEGVYNPLIIFFFLIDEYDVPLAKANEEKEGGERYYPQMLEVIRSIMSTALKSNDYLKFAVITGCLRIAKESIFTGVNNFKSYSVLDRDFSTYFGFTDTEVKDLLKAADNKMYEEKEKHHAQMGYRK